MTRLALMRHGHTSWNRAHRIQGRSDIPLDDEARDSLSALQLPAMGKSQHRIQPIEARRPNRQYRVRARP